MVEFAPARVKTPGTIDGGFETVRTTALALTALHHAFCAQCVDRTKQADRTKYADRTTGFQMFSPKHIRNLVHRLRAKRKQQQPHAAEPINRAVNGLPAVLSAPAAPDRNGSSIQPRAQPAVKPADATADAQAFDPTSHINKFNAQIAAVRATDEAAQAREEAALACDEAAQARHDAERVRDAEARKQDEKSREELIARLEAVEAELRSQRRLLAELHTAATDTRNAASTIDARLNEIRKGHQSIAAQIESIAPTHEASVAKVDQFAKELTGIRAQAGQQLTAMTFAESNFEATRNAFLARDTARGKELRAAMNSLRRLAWLAVLLSLAAAVVVIMLMLKR